MAINDKQHTQNLHSESQQKTDEDACREEQYKITPGKAETLVSSGITL